MHPYARLIQRMLAKHANPKAAVPMKRYMRNQFEYLGIKSPALADLMKGLYTEQGLPPLTDLDAVVRDLWALPQREFQYAAVGMVDKMAKQLPEEFIETLEFMLVTKSWWDTVDIISAHIVGTHFKRFPKIKRKYLAKWRKSKDFWLRRTAILFQLGYKDETDFELLKEVIRENLGSKEFFINKAIGWSLRQYSRVDPVGVRKLVKETPLHPLSAREAMKWLEKRKA